MKTLMKLAMVLVPVVVMAFSAAPVSAQQACALHEGVAKQLEKRFSEQVVGRGLAKKGRVMFELFVSKTGSWTVIATNTKGNSCVVASGDSWNNVPMLVGDPA